MAGDFDKYNSVMLRIQQILVSAIALAAIAGSLAGCGQTGPLYLPTEPAAARRATLPEILLPGTRAGETPVPPAAPASAPSSSP